MIGALLMLSLAAASDFVERGVWDGVTVSARAVPGSDYRELRFVALARGTLESLCQRAYGDKDRTPAEPYLVSREVMSEAPDERVTYERIAPPLVSRRDYVLRRWRQRSSPGSCRVDFVSVDGAPEREGWVRLKRLAGSFLLEQQPDGRVRIEHRIHMDPGGLLTPILVEPTRQELGLNFMRGLLAP
jgi:hypothetical protein